MKLLTEKEIDLTIPVNTYVQQRENDFTYYETCLVLPVKFQAAPPKANNPSVFLEDKPEQVILTRFVKLLKWKGTSFAKYLYFSQTCVWLLCDR